MSVQQIGYGYKNLTATANISSAPCTLGGFICASASTGTIAIYDSATTTTTAPVLATMSLAAGQVYPLQVSLSAGCYVVIGGTANITVMVA